MSRSFFENKKTNTLIAIVFMIMMIFFHHIGIMADHSVIVSILGMGLILFFAVRDPLVVAVLFVAALPLEIVYLVPENSAIAIRPYQFLGVAALCGAIYNHIYTKKFVIQIHWHIYDVLVGSLAVISVVLVGATDQTMAAVQQTVVLISFVMLYGVTRIFVRDIKDVIALLPVMIASGVVVSGYAILQNVIYYIGGRHLEVMPGRPNATFSEPDWLGVYLVFVCALCISYLFYTVYHKHVWRFFDMGLFGSMTIVMTALILTAARSAWLGVGCVVIAYACALFFRRKYKLFTRHIAWIGSAVGIALMVVVFGRLTSFSLSDRLHSTQSGKQEITVACDNAEGADTLIHQQVIDSVNQLNAYGCWHINVEDINYENSQGNSIVTVYRNDPNVVIRKQIYSKVIVAITDRPWTGYGWGSSKMLLGMDERGTPLNASNIFLEAALSMGLVGVSVLCMIFVITGVRAAFLFMRAQSMSTKSVALMSGLCVVAIVIPNLFNAGLFLGYIWVSFGLFAILWEKV